MTPPCLFIVLEGLTADALARGRAEERLPTLERLAAAGALADLGSPVADARAATLVSTMTGAWPDEHGILAAETLDSQTGRIRAATALDRARPAVWERLDTAGVPTISVGWGAAIRGTTTRAAIVESGFDPAVGGIHPDTLAEGLRECRLRPDELDEGAIAALVPDWQRVDQVVDARLGALAAVLAENASRHAAFLALLADQDWSMATLCLSLPAELESLERASEPLADGVFAGLAGRGLALLDAFLAAIAASVPGASWVVAGLPHGETPDLPGFLLGSGPRFGPAARLPRASVLDLAPLVWRVCGFDAEAEFVCPIAPADDRPRQPLPPVVGFQAPGDEGMLQVATPILKKAGEALTAREQWQFRALLVKGRSLAARLEWPGALPVLQALCRLTPHFVDAWIGLAEAQRELGLLDEALNSVHASIHPQNRDVRPLLLAAELEAIRGQPESARRLLARAAPTEARLLRARALVALRDWPEALSLLIALIADEPGNAPAHWLAARSHLALRQWQGAFDRALECSRLQPGNPRALEIIGHAMVGMGLDKQAAQAFESATRAAPRWARPWADRALLARRMGRPGDAAEFTRRYRLLRERWREQRLRYAAQRPIETPSSGSR